MSYINDLISYCILAKNATPDREFIVNELCDLDGVNMAIYIFEEIGGNSLITYKSFESYKKTKIRNCPKLNSPSRVLYIGSSATGLRKRIEQHIGRGSYSTYALNLIHWFTGDYKITVKKYNVSSEVLQILEDDLSWTLKPAFGKRGGNNK